MGKAPGESEVPMPKALRDQLLEDLEEDVDNTPDTLVPEGGIRSSATPVGDAPEDAIGAMQHILSAQAEAFAGGRGKGVYFRKERPDDPDKVVKGKGGEKRIVPIMQDPRVELCDLATKEGRAAYERVMELLATSLGTYQLFEPEAPPHIEIGPDGAIHAIVILKYCKVTKVISVKQEKYTEVSEEAMKERFFKHHEEVSEEEPPEEGGDSL